MKNAEKLKLLEKIASFYEKTFSKINYGQTILEKLGITNPELYARHRIGFADGSLLKALPSEGKIIEDLKELNLLSDDGKEHFKDCVIFPIMDKENKVVNISGYDGKYKRLLDSPYLWNAPILNSCPEVFNAENIIDALSLEMAGIKNVVSGGDKGIKLNLKANDILLKNGSEGLKRAVEYLPINRDCKEELEDGFKVKYGLRSYALIGIEKSPRKLKATIKAEKSGRTHYDTVNFYSAKERKQLIQDLTLVFDEVPETIKCDIERLIGESAAKCGKSSGMCLSAIETLKNMSAAEKEEANKLGKSENIFERILSDFDKCGLVGEEDNKLLCYLAMTSRKMEKPLSVMILSSSGAGKTALQSAALDFCPPEDVIRISNLSGKALFYKKSDSLKHKVLALEEQTGAEDAAYALRNLISSDFLSTETTIRDSESGKLTTMENRVEAGKTSVFITTTNPDIDAETRSRFIVTGISESREQTRTILEAQRKGRTIEGLKANMLQKKTLCVHRNFQRLLKPYSVVNPFADKLTFKDDSLAARRTQPQFLALIDAVAFLRQMKKKVKKLSIGGKELCYIEVEKEDVEIAGKLAKNILRNSMEELSLPSKDLLEQLKLLANGKMEKLKNESPGMSFKLEDISFTRRDIRKFASWRNTRLHTHLKELIDFEHVALVSGKVRSLQYYRLIDGEEFDCSELFAFNAEHEKD